MLSLAVSSDLAIFRQPFPWEKRTGRACVRSLKGEEEPSLRGVVAALPPVGSRRSVAAISRRIISRIDRRRPTNPYHFSLVLPLPYVRTYVCLLLLGPPGPGGDLWRKRSKKESFMDFSARQKVILASFCQTSKKNLLVEIFWTTLNISLCSVSCAF